jgi:hypothetical protein
MYDTFDIFPPRIVILVGPVTLPLIETVLRLLVPVTLIVAPVIAVEDKVGMIVAPLRFIVPVVDRVI